MDDPSTALLAEDIEARLEACADSSVPALRPVRRAISRELALRPGAAVLDLCEALVQRAKAPRWFSYELLHHHPEAMRALDPAALDRLGSGMSSWGEVDAFAVYVSGVAWREGLLDDQEIMRWSASDDRWWRRAALVGTVPLNVRSRGGKGDAARTLMVCRALRADRDDMVVKALSWALRELAKHEPRRVREFLSTHEGELAPRVLREVRNKLETGVKTPRRR